MENNQATENLATSLLMQLYTDYKREKNKQSRWKVLYFIICFAVFIFFLSRSTNEVILESRPHVALVRIEGTIGDRGNDADYRTLGRLLHQAFEHQDSKGVMIQIDSPGGLPYDSEVIYREIRKLREKHPEKKVICCIASAAASGAYWIAAGAEKIYAMPTSVVGSIGVRSCPMINVYEFLKEHKIEPIELQAGKNKTSLSPFKKLDEQDVVRRQHLLDNMHRIFVDGVKEGRGELLDTTRTDDLFSGEIWLAQEAKDLGLIDEIGDPQAALLHEFGDYPVVLAKDDEGDFFIEKVLNRLKQRFTQMSLLSPYGFKDMIYLS